MTTVVLLVLLVFSVSGCTRARAKTTPDVPPLAMPVPPERDVEPNEAEPPQPVPLPQEPARTPTPRPRPPAPQPREPRPTEAPKPEPPKPAEPPVITEPPKPVEDTPRPPATTLQTTPPTAEGDVERGIRATLVRATSDLDHIDYRRLNADARTQYDTAKSFIRQAEAAVRAKNLVFAKTVADKAAALAAQLGGR